MCPFCMTTAAMFIVGTISTGGLAAMVLKKIAHTESVVPSENLSSQTSTHCNPEDEHEACENE